MSDPCLICTYAGGEEALRTAAQAIFGEIPFSGRLPIQILSKEQNLTVGDHPVNLLSSPA